MGMGFCFFMLKVMNSKFFVENLPFLPCAKNIFFCWVFILVICDTLEPNLVLFGAVLLQQSCNSLWFRGKPPQGFFHLSLSPARAFGPNLTPPKNRHISDHLHAAQGAVSQASFVLALSQQSLTVVKRSLLRAMDSNGKKHGLIHQHTRRGIMQILTMLSNTSLEMQGSSKTPQHTHTMYYQRSRALAFFSIPLG